MGVWDNLLRVAKNLPVAWFTPRVTYLPVDGASAEDLIHEIQGWSPAKMYRKQPHLRTVTSFLGRNTAQLGIHVFETVDGTDRKRRRDAISARVLSKPNPTMTSYQLKYALVVDKALYDWAYLLPTVDPETGQEQLWRIPPAWVEPVPDGPFRPLKYRVFVQEAGKLPEWFAGDGERRYIDLDESDLIPFKGYDPTSTWRGSSAVESLKGTLIEQVEASKYRMQLWKRGGRVSSVLQRPANAPAWADDQAKRFRDDWYSNWTGDGARAGGTPILEDGMTLQRVDFSAMDQQWAEGARLALGTVASAFHVNPSMVGSMEKATYNNVREYRKMLYGDTLGPQLVEFEDVFNTFLLPRYGEEGLYAEFNIWAKLAGSFEEQAQFLQAAVGAPYMVRNEARSRLNLPAIDGGDELITPLNVLVGGMANPQDSGSEEAPGGALDTTEPKRRPVEVKSQVIDRDYVVKYQQVLATFYLRQGRHVESRVGAKAAWWDQQRWNSELADELVKMHLFVTQAAAVEALQAAGLDGSAYDVGRTVAYLMERAKRDAAAVNNHTKKLVTEALKDGKSINELFTALATAAALKTAQTMTTSSISWGKIESGRQSGAGSKTWVVTSKNPRSSHSAMGGQMVPLESTFSNGLHWPGDPAGGVAEVAGCTCQVNVVY